MPEDLQRAIVKMLNKILLCEEPLVHAGQFASLANSWTNIRRQLFEEQQQFALQDIENRLTALEKSKEKEPPVINLGGR